MNQNVDEVFVIPDSHGLLAWCLSIWETPDADVEDATRVPIVGWRVETYKNEADPNTYPVLAVDHFEVGWFAREQAMGMVLLQLPEMLIDFEEGDKFATLDEAWVELRRRWQDHKDHRHDK